MLPPALKSGVAVHYAVFAESIVLRAAGVYNLFDKNCYFAVFHVGFICSRKNTSNCPDCKKIAAAFRRLRHFIGLFATKTAPEAHAAPIVGSIVFIRRKMLNLPIEDAV